MNLTLEQRVEELEQNMKMLLGVEPLYKSKNNVHIDQERLNGIVREMRSESLIKDEKIRKAIKAWSEATGVSRVMTAHPNFDTTTIASIRDPYRQISFSNERAFLPKCKVYTIAELCGDSEEEE